MRSLTLALIAASILSTAPALAQDSTPAEGAAPEASEAKASKPAGAEATEPSARTEDYEEMSELEELENASRAPRVAWGGDVSRELLSPYQGVLAGVRQDSGLVPELYDLPKRAPVGSKKLAIEEVRRRLEQTKVLGQPVPLDHPYVLEYLDFFDGRGKRLMGRWLRRMAIYEPMITQTLREEGLPEDLIFVAMIESGFSPRARSPAAAVGVWQFIRKTAIGMGLEVDRHVDERRDPVKATRAAARYLKRLHDKYDSWPLALAAYNGGPGRVSGEMKRLNTNDYWSLVRHGGMHDEARHYVAKVLTVALVAKNRDLFGLHGLSLGKPWSFDLVDVHNNPSNLKSIADAIGSDVDDLLDLNPELKTASTPPQKGAYALRIPEGKASRFVARYDKVDVTESAERELHEVAFGETIDMIARHHRVSPRVLRAANGMGRRGRARYGETLTIPKKAMGKWEPKKVEQGDKRVVLMPADDYAAPGLELRYYETRRSDTVDAIARGFGLNPGDVALWNDLDLRANLRSGLVLQLYFAQGSVPRTLALGDGSAYDLVKEGSEGYKTKVRKAYAQKRSRKGRRYHKVRRGDSLWTIAKRHKTTVDKIKRLNRKLRKNTMLQIGDRIRVR